jgi:endoglucanase
MPGILVRRSFLLMTAGIFAAFPRTSGHAQYRAAAVLTGRQEWQDFQDAYVTPGGRVVDTANKNTSHSEGQGWALLLAESYNDEPAFNRILAWTRRELKRPRDSLHAWRWFPNQPIAVPDANNAADGDIFIAWALARAANRWQRPELRELAAAIARDLHEKCVREVGGRSVLLPAGFGFDKPGEAQVILNPSYYVFPALPVLAELMPEGRWQAVHDDGLALLREARFGRWGLPADWVQVPRAGGPVRPATGWPPRFSYDAVRVPLYLAWAGLGQEPAARAAARFWTDRLPGYTPAWTEFAGNGVAEYAADTGMNAVARLVEDKEVKVAQLPRVKDAPHYYAAALTMLARLAAFERTEPA